MFDPLIAHIKKFVPLSAAEENILTAALSYRSLKKKAHLLKNGEVCKAQYFILKGCLRMYLITEDGTEQVIFFGIEHWWLSDYLSFENAKSSDFNIQAVEDTNIVALDKQTQEKLFKQIPQLERYFRIVTQRAYAASQIRIKYIYTMSKEERYLHFSKSFPEFLQRVPQYMLASYLGFTPEFLSKIRGKKQH